ncbi:MAG: potassium-transporting ATPase subunit KdpC [Candidatus Acidiferrales bacterium]
MIKELGPGFRLMVVFTILTGLLYPAVMTGVSQLVFPKQANGSLVTVNGNVVGSSLIAQGFTKPEYFHPRPSVAGNGYDPTASGGSNLGPTSQALMTRLQASVAAFRKENPDFTGDIPSDILTTSASGLDPHISPAAAEAQAARVAKARGVSQDQIEPLIAQFTQRPDLGFLGEPRVNVLLLNIALDQKYHVAK